METLLAGLDPWWLAAVFVVASAVVWGAGTRLSVYAEEVTVRTGLGPAFVGALLLGGVTSLPELATVLSAAAIGNAELAVSNVSGGVAMQVAVLALADFAAARAALSSILATPVVLLQAALLIGVLTTAAAAIVVGEPAGWPVGVGTTLVFVVALGGFYLNHSYERAVTWEPILEEDEEGAEEEPHEPGQRMRERSNLWLALGLGLWSLAIVAGGYVLASTGEAIVTTTGLGASLVGAVLLAVSTSLPEVSTTLAAARLQRFDLAFSNILGTNVLDVSFLFVADLVFVGQPVLNLVGDGVLVSLLVGILCTTLYLVGLIERRDRRIWRLGVDSVAVVLVYAAGLLALAHVSGR